MLLSKILVACRLHTLKEQRFQIPKGLGVTPLCFFSLLVTCQVQFGALKIYFIHTVVGIRSTATLDKLVLLVFLRLDGIIKSFLPIFHYTSTEILETFYKTNEACEIYLLLRVCAKPYIIFQRIDKPFYPKFRMLQIPFIKTISTL